MSTSPKEAAAARAKAADREHIRAALNEERRGYVSRGLEDRVQQVDEQLKAFPAIEVPDDVEKPEDPPASTTRTGSPRTALKPGDQEPNEAEKAAAEKAAAEKAAAAKAKKA